MAVYVERAQAIHRLTTDLRRRMEAATVMATPDKLVMLDTGFEIINKLLHCFAIDPELSTLLDTRVNPQYQKLQPDPDSINNLFFVLLGVVRQVEGKTHRWVQRYAA